MTDRETEDLIKSLGHEIFRLREEVAMWKDRCEAERADHERTIEHYERMLNQLEDGR